MRQRSSVNLSKWLLGKGKAKKCATGVFGACIADLVSEPSGNEIPIIIRQCVDYLVTRDGKKAFVCGFIRLILFSPPAGRDLSQVWTNRSDRSTQKPL